jgi:uncharacterized protein
VTFRPPGGVRPFRLPRRPRYLLPAAAGVIVVIVGFTVFTGIWTDYLWYRSVHFSSIFTTTLGVKVVLFAVGGAAMAGLTGANIYLAFRLRSGYRPASLEQQGLDRYRAVLDPHRRLALGIILGLVALISGLSVTGYWRTWLLFANRTSFGRTDPQFHLDISFYTFTYPFIRFVLGFLFTAVLLSLIATVAVHYLYGGLRLQGPGERATVPARAHVFVLLGVFVLLKAVAYYFDRYGLDFSQRGAVTTGASYTDVNAVLPAKTILAVIAVVCALLFFAGAARRSVIVPAVGFGLLVLSAILVGGVYPAIIQQFQVKPNELAKESPYIQREISDTRTAYGVSAGNVRETPYPSTLDESTAQLGSQVTSLPATRLADPGVLSPAFQQLQQIKGYYQFPDTLDIDRYPVSGSSTPEDMVVAARELPGPPASQSNWINQHLVYTHGYGLVAASANNVSSSGGPSFTESDIPQQGQIPVTQPRIYFGQGEAGYSIVGAPPGRAPMELDYPNQSASEQQNYTYRGAGGVPIGSLFNRLLYSVEFRQLNILLSGSVNSQSRILYDRDPLARVAKAAPFLTLDGDPYPVVVGGRIEWVVDGYTTSANYPYSERTSLSGATTDSSGTSAPVEQNGDQINYMRNSVKAVVDAYNGTVTLYQWDSSDPVLRTWMKVFPGVVKPRSDIPAALTAHLRYPEDEFKVQRQILARYHVTQAGAFYGGQGFWDVPADPTSAAGEPQPPYYLTMNMPGDTSPQYSLTAPLVFKGRQNLAAYMAVNSNPQSPGYGQFQVLELPSDTAIPGPQQVQNAFESDPSASYYLSQYRQGGSKVILGNLITLPVGGALLYIEPIYLQASASSGGSYPTLQRVFVSFNGSTGYAATLQQALSQVISSVPSQPSQPGQPTGAAGTGPSGQAPPSGRAAQQNPAVQANLAQAEQYYKAAQAALRNGDLATYSQDIQKMNASVQAASAAAASPGSPGSSGSGR